MTGVQTCALPILLASIYNKEIEPAFSQLGNKISWRDALRIFCITLSDKQSFFLNALKNTSGQTSFRYATNDYAIDLLRERLRILGKEDELPIEIDFLAKYYMRSISEMIQDWFIGGQKIPLDNFIGGSVYQHTIFRYGRICNRLCPRSEFK